MRQYLFAMSCALLTFFTSATISCAGNWDEARGDQQRSFHPIFGGDLVASEDPVAWSTVALLEGDGEQVCSGALLTPNLIVTAAHCFASFTPYYVSFGTEVPQRQFWTDDLSDRRKFPDIREIVSHELHPEYAPSVARANEEERLAPHDIAIAFITGEAPGGFEPVNVIAPTSPMARDIVIAGFGAFPEYDPLDPAPPRLRKVETFVGEFFPQSGLFQDGPNPGKGSCVRDSGGPVLAMPTSSDVPVLIGTVVSGPYYCSEGVGYNSDLRYYLSWIELESATNLNKLALRDQAPVAPTAWAGLHL